MAKTTRKTVMRKSAAKLPPALRAMENAVVASGELDAHIRQVTETLAAARVASDVGHIAYAGRSSTGSGQVQVNINSGGFASTWPEWAYGVAEGALRFNKKVWVVYNNQPFGNNLLQVLCLKDPV